MTLIKITTDRLPQPDRRKGALLEVTPEKAASMVAQGFAEIVSAAPAAPAKAVEPVAATTTAQDAPRAPAAAPAASEAAPRRRRGTAL